MTDEKLTPAEVAIQAFGGVRKLARAVGVTPAAVAYWRRRGMISTAMQKHVLTVARKYGVDLTPEDIILGRPKKT